MILTINAQRQGYSPDQILYTMTVRELIETLEQYDGDSKVYLSHDNGYTYGGILQHDIDEIEQEDAQ